MCQQQFIVGLLITTILMAETKAQGIIPLRNCFVSSPNYLSCLSDSNTVNLPLTSGMNLTLSITENTPYISSFDTNQPYYQGRRNFSCGCSCNIVGSTTYCPNLSYLCQIGLTLDPTPDRNCVSPKMDWGCCQVTSIDLNSIYYTMLKYSPASSGLTITSPNDMSLSRVVTTYTTNPPMNVIYYNSGQYFVRNLTLPSLPLFDSTNVSSYAQLCSGFTIPALCANLYNSSYNTNAPFYLAKPVAPYFTPINFTKTPLYNLSLWFPNDYFIYTSFISSLNISFTFLEVWSSSFLYDGTNIIFYPSGYYLIRSNPTITPNCMLTDCLDPSLCCRTYPSLHSSFPNCLVVSTNSSSRNSTVTCNAAVSVLTLFRNTSYFNFSRNLTTFPIVDGAVTCYLDNCVNLFPVQGDSAFQPTNDVDWVYNSLSIILTIVAVLLLLAITTLCMCVFCVQKTTYI